jgi:TRAP-type mannitol/chloroaromatic compound transport system substrate-binding protein
MVSTQISFATENVIKWKCQTHLPAASDGYTRSAKALADEIKAKTNGRLIIELYPAGALIPSVEIFNAVNRGMIPMGLSFLGYFQDKVPLAAVASGLPMNFRDVWEAVYFHYSLGFEEMMREATAKHNVMYFTDSIFPVDLAIKKPINSLDDFKGLKIRSSGIMQKYLTSIGAAASFIPGGEVYAALASGVSDGAHWGDVLGSEDMGFFEVCKYLLRPSISVATTQGWLISEKAFNALPGDIQKILQETMNMHCWKRTNERLYLATESAFRIKNKYNVQTVSLSDADYSKLQEGAVAFWDEVAKISPECQQAVQLIKDFNRSLGRIK